MDVMDAVGSNIVVNTRCGEVMRVLPRMNEVRTVYAVHLHNDNLFLWQCKHFVLWLLLLLLFSSSSSFFFIVVIIIIVILSLPQWYTERQ